MKTHIFDNSMVVQIIVKAPIYGLSFKLFHLNVHKRLSLLPTLIHSSFFQVWFLMFMFPIVQINLLCLSATN